MQGVSLRLDRSPQLAPVVGDVELGKILVGRQVGRLEADLLASEPVLDDGDQAIRGVAKERVEAESKVDISPELYFIDIRL